MSGFCTLHGWHTHDFKCPDCEAAKDARIIELESKLGEALKGERDRAAARARVDALGDTLLQKLGYIDPANRLEAEYVMHEARDRIIAAESRLGAISSVLARNGAGQVTDADAMSEIHELYYQATKGEARDSWGNVVEKHARGCPTIGCAMPFGHEEPCHLRPTSE